jgi:hypothetical protein
MRNPITPVAAALGLLVAVVLLQAQPGPALQVKIEDEKPGAASEVFGIDPASHVQLSAMDALSYGMRVDNTNLDLQTMWNWFNIDGRITWSGQSGKVTLMNQPLSKPGAERPRLGHRSVWQEGKLFVTQEIEVVATRPQSSAGRRRDAVLIRYVVENKDEVPHKLGIRPHLNDVLIMNNRGVAFAAPNHPNKILDGVELKGDKVPDYVKLLQRADLKSPGFVGHVTLKLGSGYEKPDRVVLTRTGALTGDKWDATVAPSNGHSGLVLYWDPKEIKPGGVRKAAYAFGQGIAIGPDGDGLVALRLNGSFEPGKLFTIAAQVQDPAVGQSLTLELPAGMERVEGKERQPVPAVDDDGISIVLWKARVLNPGRFAVRVHSSTGDTQGKIITISRPGETP